jgi:site-specific recombinase XerD
MSQFILTPKGIFYFITRRMGLEHEFSQPFATQYDTLLKCLKLRGMQPKTIESYSHGVRRAASYFAYKIDALTREQLTDYFVCLVDEKSWSTVKHDLYGLKFFYAHVLNKPWPGSDLIKPPKVSRLPDIVTVEQMQRIVDATRVLSYRVFFFVLYSMGLRLGEGLQLQVGDIDQDRMRVHIRDAKGNRDRLVPLPAQTLSVLREFWKVHRNPVLLFPSRQKGLGGASGATTHMDRGGVQQALRQVTMQIGLKKELRRIACATPMQLI